MSCGTLLERHYQSQTCGSPECRAMIILHPQVKEPGRTGTPWGKGKWKPRPNRETLEQVAEEIGLRAIDHELLRVGALELAQSSQFEVTDWGMARDERGADRPEALGSIWSWLSRRKVYLKSIGSQGGEASLTLRVGPEETVQEAFARSAPGLAPGLKSCEVLYAWRCPCDLDHRVEYDTLEDLPSEEGYHNSCPRCGAAPLEVIR